MNKTWHHDSGPRQPNVKIPWENRHLRAQNQPRTVKDEFESALVPPLDTRDARPIRIYWVGQRTPACRGGAATAMQPTGVSPPAEDRWGSTWSARVALTW